MKEKFQVPYVNVNERWKYLFLSLILFVFLLEIIWVLFIRKPASLETFEYGSNLFATQNDNLTETDIKINVLKSSSILPNWQLAKIRSESVAEYKNLFANSYTPLPYIFNNYDDSAPWLSEAEYFLGDMAKEIGDSSPYNSIGLFNPLVFLWPDFYELSSSQGLNWNKESTLKAISESKSVPLYPIPTSLNLKPGMTEAVLSYNLSDYLNSLNNWVLKKIDPANIKFRIRSLNAADFGFNFIALSLADSDKIAAASEPAVQLNATFLQTTSEQCIVSKLCNQEISQTRELQSLVIQSLPAKATFKLWRKLPEKSETPPDLIYTIKFE